MNAVWPRQMRGQWAKSNEGWRPGRSKSESFSIPRAKGRPDRHDPEAAVLAIIAIVAVGGLIGAMVGVLVVYLKFNAFIATLATLILLRVSLGITHGETLSNLPPLLTLPGDLAIGIVPLSFVIALVLLGAITLFMSSHRLGRMLYAVGGNAQAARVAGIPVERVLTGVFVAAGVLASLVGLMQAGRIASISSSLG